MASLVRLKAILAQLHYYRYYKKDSVTDIFEETSFDSHSFISRPTNHSFFHPSSQHIYIYIYQTLVVDIQDILVWFISNSARLCFTICNLFKTLTHVSYSCLLPGRDSVSILIINYWDRRHGYTMMWCACADRDNSSTLVDIKMLYNRRKIHSHWS